jgi:hypothetical protein
MGVWLRMAVPPGAYIAARRAMLYRQWGLNLSAFRAAPAAINGSAVIAEPLQIQAT